MLDRQTLGQRFFDATLARAKKEIMDMVQMGMFVGAQITSFRVLHDHTDANELGGLCDENFPLEGDELVDFGNELQDTLDVWIRDGALTTNLAAANRRWLTAGELRRHLETFPDDTPVTVGVNDGWLNIIGATNPYESGEPSVVLVSRDDFSVTQF